jgi:hypothetical protein
MLKKEGYKGDELAQKQLEFREMIAPYSVKNWKKFTTKMIE